MKISGPDPENDFTRIPNSLLSCPLSTGEKVTWIQLMSLCRNGISGELPRGCRQASEALGLEYGSFVKAVKRLRTAGGLVEEDDCWRLVVPDQRITAAIKPAQELQPSIAREVQQQERRKPSGIKAKDSWQAMREAWNKEKPEAWTDFGASFNNPVFIAIETQAKKLGIERSGYAGFVAEVCRGAGADNWWKERTMKPSNIFGLGVEIDDKKFLNVEKLRNLGKKAPKLFSWDDDYSVFSWYAEACPGVEFKSIQRIELPTLDDCWQHDWNGENREDVIFIYTNQETGRIEHWTGKTHNRKLYQIPA